MPLSFTLGGATKEADILQFGREAIPLFLFANDREEEEVKAFRKIMYLACLAFDDWQRMTYLLKADGKWLDEHAKDRGTFRQQGENDASLASRLRTVDDALTRVALLAVAQRVIDGAISTWTSNLTELKRSKGFFLTSNSPDGVGDSFAKSGSTVTLTDVGFTFIGNEVGRTVTIAGAATAGNDGTFTITAVTDHSISYVNASGTAEAFAGTWKIDAVGDGFKDAFLSRGYRMGATSVSAVIFILPFTSTASVQAALREAIRVRKAAGIEVIVERRLNP